MSEQKQIVNSLCHSSINTALSAAYIMIGKKAIIFKTPEAGKFSLEDIGLIAVSIAAADLIREYAVKKGWIPETLNI